MLVPAPSAGDSAISMTNAITVARFVSGVMEIKCGSRFLQQWGSMLDVGFRDTFFQFQRSRNNNIQKEKEEWAGENDFDNSHDQHSVLTNTHIRASARTHTHTHRQSDLSKSVLW